MNENENEFDQAADQSADVEADEGAQISEKRRMDRDEDRRGGCDCQRGNPP